MMTTDLFVVCLFFHNKLILLGDTKTLLRV